MWWGIYRYMPLYGYLLKTKELFLFFILHMSFTIIDTFLLNFIRLKKSVQCIFILHLIKVQFHCFFGMFNPKFQVFLFLFLPVFEFQYLSQDVQDNIAHI